MDTRLSGSAESIDLSGATAQTIAPDSSDNPAAVEGQMGRHNTTPIPEDQVIIRVKYPSESEKTPLVISGPGAKSFEYWPEDEVKSKEPEPFSDRTVIELIKGSNTQQGRNLSSQFNGKIKGASAFVEQAKRKAPVFERNRSLTASVENLLQVSEPTPLTHSEPHHNRALSTTVLPITNPSSERRLAVTMMKDSLPRAEQSSLCDIPKQSPFQPSAFRGEYCLPITPSFKRSGEDFSLTDEQVRSVLHLSPIAECLEKQRMSSDGVYDRGAFKHAITHSNFTIQITLGDKNCPVYSSASTRGSLKEEGRAKSKAKHSLIPLEDSIGELAAKKLEKVVPDAESTVYSLVQQNAAFVPAQKYAECHGVEITSDAAGDVTSSYTVTAASHDEFRVDITSIYNQLKDTAHNKTQTGFLQVNLSVRFVRKGDFWVPNGCACAFDIETNAKTASSRLKATSEIRKTYLSEQNVGKKLVRDAQKSAKSSRTSLESLPCEWTRVADHEHFLRTRPLSRSLSSGINYRVAAHEPFPMRQKSEEFGSQLRVMPGDLSSSNSGSDGSKLSLPFSEHHRQNSSTSEGDTSDDGSMFLPPYSAHIRQNSDHSDSELSDQCSAPGRSLPMESSSLVQVGTQFYLTNCSKEMTKSDVAGAEVVQRYTDKLKLEVQRFQKLPRSVDDDAQDIINRLAKQASNLSQTVPSDRLFAQYMDTVRADLKKKFGDQAAHYPESAAIQAKLTAQNETFTREWLEYYEQVKAKTDMYTPPAIHDDWETSLTEDQVTATRAAMDAIKEDCDGFKEILAEFERVSEEIRRNPKNVMVYLEKVTDLHCRSIKITDNVRGSKRVKGLPKHRKLQDAIELERGNEQHQRILAHINALKTEIHMLKSMCSNKTEVVLMELRAANKKIDAELQRLGEAITGTEAVVPADILEGETFAAIQTLEQIVEPQALPEKTGSRLRVAVLEKRPVSDEDIIRFEEMTGLCLAGCSDFPEVALLDFMREIQPFFNLENRENIIAFLDTLV